MPVVMSPSFLLSPPAGSRPLTHGRIGHQSWTRAAGVVASATSSATDFPAAAILNWLTYQAWKPVSLPATLKIDLGVARDVDYAGLVHTLGEAGAALSIEYSTDDVTYTPVAAIAPGSNRPIFSLFDSVFARYWQYVVTGGGDAPTLNVGYLGQVLELERGINVGHSPLTLSRTSVIQPNTSEGGQFLGRSVVRKGFSTKVQLQYLTSAFVRDEFDKFVKDARYYPYFWAWRPATYPDEVGFAQTNKDIHPTNMKRTFMQVSWDLEALDADAT